MKMEWLRADDNAADRWACFLIFEDRADVLAVIGPKERVDRSMTVDEARKLWTDLQERGWHRASDTEIDRYAMTHGKLREIAYGRRRT